MATREAAVKVTIKSAAAAAGLKNLEEQTKRTGSRMREALGSSMKAGLGAAKGTLRDMVSNAVSTLKTAATLGGAFSVGKFLKDAVTMRAMLRDLEFQVNKTGTQAIKWQDIQTEIHRVTDKTAVGQAELAEAFKTVFSATGDSKFALAALDAIGVTSAATGDDVQQLANVAQLLQRKFGATAETLPAMMARFVEKTGVGGPALEGLGNKFALMAGEAREAGFEGEKGLSMLLGTMIRLDSRVGEKTEPGMKRTLQVLKRGSMELRALQKESGVKFKGDEDFFEKIEKLLGGKGRKAIEARLTGEARTVFDELVKPFDEAFAQAKAGGKSAKEATELATAAFRKSLNDAGKSTLKFEKLVDMANEELQEEPEAKFKLALEKMARAFEKPEMMKAVDSLAQNLPKLAEGITKLIDFVVKNPKTAVAGAVGGKLALSFAGAAISDLGSNIGKSATKEMAGSATSVGKEIGKSAAGAMRPAAPGGGLHPTVAGVAAVGGSALAVDQFSKLMKETGQEDRSLLEALPGFKKGGKFDSDELMKNLAATLTFGVIGGKDAHAGVKAGRFIGSTARGVFTAEDRANALARSRYLSTDTEEIMAQAKKGDLTAALTARGGAPAKELEEGTKKAGEEANRAATAFDKVTKSAERAAQKLEGLSEGPGGSGKGPRPLGPVTPGATPRPG